jgi:hypothetical protein
MTAEAATPTPTSTTVTAVEAELGSADPDHEEIDDYEYDDPNDPYLQKINFKSIRSERRSGDCHSSPVVERRNDQIVLIDSLRRG